MYPVTKNWQLWWRWPGSWFSAHEFPSSSIPQPFSLLLPMWQRIIAFDGFHLKTKTGVLRKAENNVGKRSIHAYFWSDLDFFVKWASLEYISGGSWPPTPKDISEPSHGRVFCERFHFVYVVKGVWGLLTDLLFSRRIFSQFSTVASFANSWVPFSVLWNYEYIWGVSWPQTS